MSLKNGLVGYYPFSGHARNFSGNNYHGAVTGATLTTDEFGNANSAYLSQGSGSGTDTNYSINLGAAIIGNQEDFTIVTRLKFNNTAIRNSIIRRNSEFIFEYGSIANRIGFAVYNTATTNSAIYYNGLTQGQYYTLGVRCVYDGTNTTVSLFVDGISVGTPVSFTGKRWDSGSTMQIFNGTFYPFAGVMDNMYIYNRGLSNKEIKQIHNALRRKQQIIANNIIAPIEEIDTTGLVGYYPMNGNARDLSGKNYHGTVTGATLTTDQFGNANSAYSFNGVSDYITLIAAANSPFANTGMQLVNIVAYIEKLNDLGVMFANVGGPSNNRFYINIATDNNIQYNIGQTAGNIITSGLRSNGRHSITVIRDATNNKVYAWFNGVRTVNGVTVTIGTPTYQAATFLGKISGGVGDTFTGKISDVQIKQITSIPTDAEIKQLYNKLMTEKTQVIEGEVIANINEIDTTESIIYVPTTGSARDFSGNNYNGTVIRATLTTDEFGRANSAYEIDGVDDYIELNDGQTPTEFSIAGKETSTEGLEFKPDGTMVFIIGTISKEIHSYTMSTPWDITTASFTASSTVVAGKELNPTDVRFSSDGTKVYILGYTGQDITYFTLSTPYNITTMTYVGEFSLALQDTQCQGFHFKPDGTKFYVLGRLADKIFQYSMSTPRDMSTSLYDNISKDITGEETDGGGIFLKNDGTLLYVIGIVGDDINIYNLSTPRDISTATFNNITFYVGNQETAPKSLCFKPDGTNIYVVGNTSDKIYSYTLSSARSFSNPLYSNGFTIKGWIRPDTVGEGAGRIIDKTVDAGSTGGYQVSCNPFSGSNNITFKINAGAEVRTTTGAVVYGSGIWYRLIISVAANATVTFYINGQQSGTPGTTGALSGITTTNKTRIGNRSGATDRTFDGGIADIQVIGRPYTAQEALQDYNQYVAIAQQDIDPVGLAAYYPMSNGSNDWSVNRYNGTITGNTTFSSDINGGFIYFNGDRNSALATGTIAQMGLGTPAAFNFQPSNSFTLIWYGETAGFPSTGCGIMGSNFSKAFHLLSTGRIGFGLRSGVTTESYATPNNTFIINTKYVVTMKYDGVVKKLYAYKNGVLLNTGGLDITLTSFDNGQWSIGDNAIYGGNIISQPVKCYDARIYSYGVSDAEILALSNKLLNENYKTTPALIYNPKFKAQSILSNITEI